MVCWRDRPYFSKKRKMSQNFGLLDFKKLFTLCFYFIIFRFWTKHVTTKTKKNLSYVRSSHIRCLVIKGLLKIFKRFTENHRCGVSFYKSCRPLSLLCKYSCDLAIVKCFYTNKAELFFLFLYHRLKVFFSRSHFFSFCSCFTRCSPFFSLKRFAWDIIIPCSVVLNIFSKRITIDYYNNWWKRQ